MREIGEGDEGPPTDAQQFVEHPIRPARGLQRLAEDGIIEAVIGIVGEIAIGIALHHRQPLRHRGGDIGGVEFEPARVHSAPVAQGRHQRAVAAADVEHARHRLDVGGDDRKIGAQRRRRITRRGAHRV
jgi:hypothetical protein